MPVERTERNTMRLTWTYSKASHGRSRTPTIVSPTKIARQKSAPVKPPATTPKTGGRRFFNEKRPHKNDHADRDADHDADRDTGRNTMPLTRTSHKVSPKHKASRPPCRACHQLQYIYSTALTRRQHSSGTYRPPATTLSSGRSG